YHISVTPLTIPDTTTLSLHDALPILRSAGRWYPSSLPLPGPQGTRLETTVAAYVRPTYLSGQSIPRNSIGRVGRLLLRGRCNNPDRKSTRLNSSHLVISYAVFCLKKK